MDNQTTSSDVPAFKAASLNRNLNDASAVAAALLDDFIEAESPEEVTRRQLQTVAIDEARVGSKVISRQTGRNQSRVLFVTENTNYLNENSRVFQDLKFLSIIFDELHVMVISKVGKKEEVMRASANAWVYKVGYRYWWTLPFLGKEFAEENLIFADSFRPDIVVALEPYLAGVVGWYIGKKFKRPFQVHIVEDCFSDLFVKRETGNNKKKRIAKWVIKHSQSQRVATSALKNYLKENFALAETVGLMPKFYNFSALLKSKPAFDLHQLYQGFSFIILAFADLKSDGPLQDVFSALHQILINPRVGLIVVGDGPALELYTEKAKILGIEKNVVFKKNIDDLISYLQTADMLIQTDTSKDGDEIVFKAAAAGLPIVMYETELRNDLFEDGETASLCEPGDTYALSKEVRNFLNNPALRKRYSQGARNMVSSRIQEDDVSYYQAYRDSIETAVSDALS